ncbi:4-hydroxybenzoate octaprenyltransferase [Saccharopolyspora pogona]|uniref:4-hydroxybenzoate octaprenyltransferase n=1 Tax=Saccharopolyspora pogona TaxID=333966 RepID=UPI001CC238F9|nr:4-hydroxybenzoate octaprenyltransferase [Saccharopolyspora pogona]
MIDISAQPSQQSVRNRWVVPSIAASVVPRAPKALLPYLQLARVHAPIGSWLYLLPGLWGMALASAGLPDWRQVLLFAIGAVLVRGFGCTVNDIVDHKVDARVARTAARPIPAGSVTVAGALVFAVVQAVAALLVLAVASVPAAALVAASYPLVVAYPFMKRITYWPQAWLGLVFNSYVLAGWLAVTGRIETPALLLYVAGFFWTLGFDTIYAHQDKADDLLAGVKSAALRLGRATRTWVAGFYGATVVGIVAAGAVAGVHWTFYALLLPSVAQLYRQVATVDIDNPADCREKFVSNRFFGWLVLVAIVVGRVL